MTGITFPRVEGPPGNGGAGPSAIPSIGLVDFAGTINAATTAVNLTMTPGVSRAIAVFVYSRETVAGSPPLVTNLNVDGQNFGLAFQLAIQTSALQNTEIWVITEDDFVGSWDSTGPVTITSTNSLTGANKEVMLTAQQINSPGTVVAAVGAAWGVTPIPLNGIGLFFNGVGDIVFPTITNFTEFFLQQALFSANSRNSLALHVGTPPFVEGTTTWSAAAHVSSLIVRP